MSGIITLVIALILLVAAVYNLISYIRDRRSASLPSKKTKRWTRLKQIPPCSSVAGILLFLAYCGHKKAPAIRQGPVSGRNRDVAASPAGRDAPRVAGEPHPALISGTHDGLALEGVSE